MINGIANDARMISAIFVLLSMFFSLIPSAAYFNNSQKLMALAAATFSESTPWYIGIITR